MSLPPGFLDELRTRTSLGQVAGRKVMWDARKSNQGKGDLWAPCPFHQEKTASFHVDDRKGYYYCFGCHAKGDAISFVRETENVEFMEAVRILAAEAGMQMPERDPRAQQKADRLTQLAQVMEAALRHFRLMLRSGAGAAARDYLAGRGLDEAAQDRFEIGFALDAWQGLWDHLKGKGVEDELILGCGLAKPSQKGGKPYDTFRNRIIYPIRDARGRCIAFGGRAMDPTDGAKYLNSPETELFDKSRTLYNHAPAREAAGKGNPLIVAEGYMDVIALAEAGFTGSVAPLGTAVTEHQLAMLWRIADEPVVALDGDTAGLRAAYRVIDLALPLLEAGKSLRFALMPEGQDPDDLIRSEGPAAIQARVDKAMPMVELLWRRETEGQSFDSPERKAALDKALREKIRLIRDPSIRSHYGQTIKDMRWKLFNARSPQQGRGIGRWQKPEGVRASTKSSLLASSGEGAQVQLREAVILAVLIRTPSLLPEFEAALDRIPCQTAEHAAIRDALLRLDPTDKNDLAAAIGAEIGAEAVEKLFAQPHLRVVPALRRVGNVELAQMTVSEAFAKLETERGLAAEIIEAEQDLADGADETVTWRLNEAVRNRQKALRSEKEDKTEFKRGANGAPVNRSEQEDLNALIDEMGFSKGAEG
ncbi:MAG: DNA primase [Pseudomonadota bacterium]